MINQMTTPIDPKRREQWEREAHEYAQKMYSPFIDKNRGEATFEHPVIAVVKEVFLTGREAAEVEIQELNAGNETLSELVHERWQLYDKMKVQIAQVKDAYMGMLEMGAGNKPMEIAAYNKALEVARSEGWLPE